MYSLIFSVILDHQNSSQQQERQDHCHRQHRHHHHHHHHHQQPTKQEIHILMDPTTSQYQFSIKTDGYVCIVQNLL
jgi:hypothetical protein